MIPEPYRIKMVEPIHLLPRNVREEKIENTGFNLFGLRSEEVFIDMLSDSGTGAMSTQQWSALMMGDESYAGSASFYRMKESIADVMGFPYVLPTHQGRAAENVLHSALIKEHDVVPGNSHFDTTKAHIEFRKAHAIDCTIDEAFDPDNLFPFKGNLNLEKLRAALTEYVPQKRVPFVLVTVTCNSAGGQPVSMENMRGVKQLCDEFKVTLFVDAARYAENCKFIQMRETGYASKSSATIAREFFSYADGCTMSSKKDALVNIGGFIAMRDEELYRQCSIYGILFEGFVTYGGMSGRDMETLAVGLKEGIDDEYLEHRLAQTKYLSDLLTEAGVPHVKPAGGHAIYVDALKVLPNIPREHFPAQTLGVEIYIEAGVRGVEIGAVLADRDPVTRENRYPRLELLRLCLPRRTFTSNHLEWVAEGLHNVMRRSSFIRGLQITYEPPILRHFTTKFVRV
ncbi:MAG: tryptophanase [bacterium]|nr:tryptophanase [bacterium]